MSKKRCIGNGNTQICVLPRAKLVFCSANRAENLRYRFKQGQNSCRSFAKLSAWYIRNGGTPAPEQKPSLRQRQRASMRIAKSLARFIALLTAQRICDSSSKDKNSCRSFAKLSAWWLAPLAVCRKSPLLSLRAQAWQSRGSGMM